MAKKPLSSPLPSHKMLVYMNMTFGNTWSYFQAFIAQQLNNNHDFVCHYVCMLAS